MQEFMVTLLICSAAMSVLALLYMSLTPFLAKRYSEKGRYYAWLIIVIGLIIPFRPSWTNAIFTVDVGVADVSNDFVNTATQAWSGNVATMPTFTAYASPTSIPETFSITLWHGITAAWLIGVAAFISYQTIRHYRFVKTARRWSETIADEKMLSIFRELKMEMGIERQIGLYFSYCVGSPMMIGFIKPKILLPTEELTEKELRFILKHELVHYKRSDLLYKSLVLIATAMHWFNPIVYLTARTINILCETSCDAEVMQNANEDTRQRYSETIINMVKYRSKMKLPTAFSTNFYGGKKGMKNRISSIMDMSKKRAGTLILCGALVLTLGTGAVVAASAIDPTNQEIAMPNSAVAEQTAIIRVTNGEASRSVDSGQTWQHHDVNEEFDFVFEEMTVAELENQLAELRANAEALVASGDHTWEEITAAITLMEEQIAQVKEGTLTIGRPFSVEGSTVSISISGMFQYDDVTIVNEVFAESTFTVIDDSNYLANRPATAHVFAEYEEWGLTIEGLYPHPNGGFTANSRQNVFLHGQLMRGFTDFDNDVVSMSISSADRGGSEWVRVIRNANGNIERIDTE